MVVVVSVVAMAVVDGMRGIIRVMMRVELTVYLWIWDEGDGPGGD